MRWKVPFAKTQPNTFNKIKLIKIANLIHSTRQSKSKAKDMEGNKNCKEKFVSHTCLGF